MRDFLEISPDPYPPAHDHEASRYCSRCRWNDERKRNQNPMANLDPKYIAVFNTNPGGNVVARLITVPIHMLLYSEASISDSGRRNLLRQVQESLPAGHNVCGVSNVLPSSHGMGGAYIMPVSFEVPQPKPKIQIGNPIRALEDLGDGFADSEY